MPSYFFWVNFFEFLPFVNAVPKVFSHPQNIDRIGKFAPERSTLLCTSLRTLNKKGYCFFITIHYVLRNHLLDKTLKTKLNGLDVELSKLILKTALMNDASPTEFRKAFKIKGRVKKK